VPPYGLALGGPRAPTSTYLLRDGVRIDFPTPGKVAGFAMRRGDVLVMESAGGGGWGDPLDREPAQVAEDVAQGYLSEPSARSRYGVVLDEAGAVDGAATTTDRDRLRAARRHVRVLADERAPFTGVRGRRRLAHLPPDPDLPEGTLIELHGRHPAPLRAWVAHDPGLAGGQCALGAEALTVIGLTPGDPAHLRVLASPVPQGGQR
jgi:N-methylhydantoinase B